MTDVDRVLLPDGDLTGEWCERQAARILLAAETVIDNGDKVATHASLAEAWRDLAASIRGE